MVQGTQDTQERPTLEAEPRGQLPMRADMCAQLALATMAAGPGRMCDNPSCNAALQIEPVLNLGYGAVILVPFDQWGRPGHSQSQHANVEKAEYRHGGCCKL